MLDKIHHSDEDYEAKAAEAAELAKARFNLMIKEGTRAFRELEERLRTEVPDDALVATESLTLAFTGDGPVLVHTSGTYPLHRNALNQFLEQAGMGAEFFRVRFADVADQPEYTQHRREDLVRLVNTLWVHPDRLGKKWLMRRVGNVIRSIMTRRYKPADSRLILEAFAGAMMESNAVPLQALVTDTRYVVRAVHGEVFEPIPNEPMLIGLELRGSDHGNGAQTLRTFITRVWCTNTAIGELAMREVHLGAPLPDDLPLTQETYRLNSEATAATVRDLVKALVGPAAVAKVTQQIREAHAVDMTWAQVAQKIGKLLTTVEKEKAKEIWEKPRRDEQMPSGNNRWAASNLLSWLAKNEDSDDIERRLRLERAAGQMLVGAPLTAEEDETLPPA
jgi:hypothetical protein